MTQSTTPLATRNELPELLRARMESGGIDDVVELVVSLFDQLSEAHARVLIELKRSLRARYGRKSEQLSPEQLELLADVIRERVEAEAAEEATSQASLVVDESEPRDPAAPKKKRRARGAPRFPEDLPRETIQIPVSEAEQDCPICGEPRAVIGYETQEILEYTPASFHVREVRCEKRACSSCKKGVVTAKAPPRIYERGSYGAGLIAQILVSKFKDGLPLYRQRQIYKRHRVDLPRSTLGDRVARGTFALAPVAERIRQRVLDSEIVQTDDTGLAVLDRDHPKHIKRGHLWPYVADDLAYFDYTPTWSGAGPQAFLEDFVGYLQVDGYKGYDALFGPESLCIEVGCMAHARRYFYEACESGDLLALEMLAYIRDLYRVETRAREVGLGPDARQGLRKDSSVPILSEMETWLEQHALAVPPRSKLGEAIHYMHGRWAALRRSLDDGRLEIDNSKVERLIRIVVVARKNFLFAGSDAGAERGAIAYTLIASATLHEIDPWLYLKDLLECIAAGWPQREIDALLPDRWLADHPDALRRNRPA